MNLWSRGLTAVLLAALISAPVRAAKPSPVERMEPVPPNEQIPLKDFFRSPLFTDLKLNPAGTHFAATVETDEGNIELMAYDMSAKTREWLTAGEDFDIPTYSWLNDTRLLFTLSDDKGRSGGLFAVELGQFSRTFVLQRSLALQVLGYPKAHNRQAIIWFPNVGVDGSGKLLKIDTRQKLSHAPRDFASGSSYALGADVVTTYPNPEPGDPVGFVLDAFGEPAFAFTGEDDVTKIQRMEGGKWSPCPIDLKETEFVGVGDKSSELLVLAQKEMGKPRALYRLDSKTGALGELLLQDDRYDLRNVRFYRHPVNSRLLGAHYDRKSPHSAWFDPKYGEIQGALNRAFPNDMVRIIGSDRNEKQFAVAVFSDLRPMSYHQVNLETGSAKLIADVMPWIDPKRMQRMQLITYKSRDGFEIEGYVTLPAGAAPTNKVPLVVFPHAAPWSRTIWGWNAMAQFLASRGYAVFQPNYRGSSGTAWRFPDESSWDVRSMHHDVTDGVKTVLRTGLIDPDRLAIVGDSFGGYLALSGAAHEPELYRCAITASGVFEWAEVFKEAGSSMYARGQYGGLKPDDAAFKEHRKKIEEFSPMRHVKQIRIPILVAHGTEGVVPSVAQSKHLVQQLEKFGVPHEKLIQRGERRGFRQLEHRVKLYTAMEAFLAKHLARR